ncbi:exonuclease SbcCD subunit D [Deinococcus ruber]|uniref:Nuclease SbcCD subunit D n=1 Tax=Deinococcus ruber TaxID=1848197 RepID=A0A918BZ25_9DEIO|nr:exonuclease SbcCD subunit D [Deinococcus ruber]GGQ99317.1 nuclease SbcCD subunit D [Deinococcus ruber]
MRVLHTADFHAGRITRGYDRTSELRDALTEIAGLARTERADAVLVAGDLFDSVNPSAAAEGIVFEFFLRLKELGIPSVVIAGNHDSAHRLGSLKGLLGWVGVQMVADLSADLSALTRTLETRSGERLIVGAIPYISERRLLRAADLLGQDVGEWRQKYRDGVGQLMREVGKTFDPTAVNMMMLHTTLDGAKPSGQRSVVLDLNKTYTITGMQFPAGTQYAALGHVHKPQQLGEGVLAAYPGSLLQLDFGEGGEQKQVNLVEVFAGRPAQITPIPLASGLELRTLKVTHADLERRLEEAKSFQGLLKVVVSAPPGTALPGLKETVLRILPNVLAVELDAASLPGSVAPLATREGLSRLELFERYYQTTRGELPAAVRAAFIEAQQAVTDEAREGGAA